MAPAERRTTDAGFTLTEVVIVVFLLGLIMPVLAMAFSVVVRTTATSEDRADDSRSLLNLTTWLSQDVSSTSEDGFYIGASAGGCDPLSIPESKNLLELHWREGSQNYVTNYRWVSTGSSKGQIFRYACLQGQTANELRMTAELNEVSSGDFAPAPVEITPTPATLADGSPGIKGVEFVVLIFDEYGIQRELLSLDATTTNVMTLLPDGTSGPGLNNTPPSASDLAMTITQGGTKVEEVPMIDENLDPLFVTFPNGLPVAWNILASGTTIQVTPDPAAVPGDYDITYRVTDPSGSWADAILKVTVLASGPNQAPIANAVSVNTSRSRPVVATLVYSDPEGELPLTPVLGPLPAGWTATLNGNQATITPSATASGSATIEYTVTDSVGLTATSQIVVNVCTVTFKSISPASASVLVTTDGNLSEPVTVAIQTNGACGPLVLGFLPDKTSVVEQAEAFNASNVVTINTTNTYAWFKPNGNSSRVVKLNVREGANGPIDLSLDLTTKGTP
jgi:prepilin-type N-terminal cleavage/methylation domain-containing protein